MENSQVVPIAGRTTEALDRWGSCTCRCRIPAFVKLQRTSSRTPVDPGRDRARPVQPPHPESVNAKVRLITRIVFGFKSPEALIVVLGVRTACSVEASGLRAFWRSGGSELEGLDGLSGR